MVEDADRAIVTLGNDGLHHFTFVLAATERKDLIGHALNGGRVRHAIEIQTQQVGHHRCE